MLLVNGVPPKIDLGNLLNPKCSFASRAFCVSLPNNWNYLPLHIRSSDSLATFQSRLKSHLFASAYHVCSHPHASASDSTFDYWRYINISLTLTYFIDIIYRLKLMPSCLAKHQISNTSRVRKQRKLELSQR